MDARNSFSRPGTDEEPARLNNWQAIRSEVLARIRSGQWPPGSLIPTEHELAKEMGCARATVNRALRELADSGIIQRRRKVGTRVAARPTRSVRLDLPAMRDEIEARGGSYVYRLDAMTTEAPTPAAATFLRLDEGEAALRVQATHLSGRRAWCCETVWLAPNLSPEIEDGAFNRQSPHDWLAENLPLAQAQFAILPEGATREAADQLGLVPGSPVLVIERMSLRDGVPLTFSRQVYPPQHRLELRD